MTTLVICILMFVAMLVAFSASKIAVVLSAGAAIIAISTGDDLLAGCACLIAFVTAGLIAIEDASMDEKYKTPKS